MKIQTNYEYRNWEKELERHKRGQKPRLLMACLRTFGTIFTYIGLANLLIVIILELDDTII